ncbi:hypothetical protein TWF506_009610 [Arthrobotrys conoides]|uniref:Uncharacterized protein n=1 Tax=Arthrobotrys conoides TaxID=74498 RepID=A0AAN8NBV1_9PEZI
MTKPDPITGRQSKYFFLKSLTEIDTPTIDQSKFWYDTLTRTIFSETTVEVHNSGDSSEIDSNPSIEDDFFVEGQGSGAGGSLVPGISSLNLAALEGGDAQMPPPMLEVDPVTQTEMWELFGSTDIPSGALKAADLEVASSVNNLVAQTYTGNKKLEFRLVGEEAGQTDGQLWLWRCVFGLGGTPLGPSIMSQFPNMDPAVTAEFFKGMNHVLLVKPKYEDQVAQKPKSWDPLEPVDGMNCFRIDPWKNVLAVSANEMEGNLQGIKQGTYDYESRSVQIINVGGLFPELQEEEPLLSPSEEGSPEEGPGDWTQQLQVPSKLFGSQGSVYSEHMKSP